MPDIVDIHKFFEANLPGYQRRDDLACIRFFLEQTGKSIKKPIKTFLAHFQEMKEFVCYDWQGEEISDRKPVKSVQGKGDGLGRCNCGGHMIKKKNRADGSLFLGCSRYPKCKNTKPYLL